MFTYLQEETIRKPQVGNTRKKKKLVKLGPWETGDERNIKYK